MDKIPAAYSGAEDGADHNVTNRGTEVKAAEVCRLIVDARGTRLTKVVEKGPLGTTTRTTMEAFCEQVGGVRVVRGYYPTLNARRILFFKAICEMDRFFSQKSFHKASKYTLSTGAP